MPCTTFCRDLTTLIVVLLKQPNDDEERVQLLRNTDTLHRTSGNLHHAQEVSARTDEIADNIMNDLDEQKSSLIRTRNRVNRSIVGSN